MKATKAKVIDRLGSYLLNKYCDKLLKAYLHANEVNGEPIDFHLFAVGECEHRAKGIYKDILRTLLNRYEESDHTNFFDFIDYIRHEAENRLNNTGEEVT